VIDPQDIEAIAHRVVELLEERGLAADVGPRLVSAAEVARRLSRSRPWVYDHADELGAVKLGTGDRPRLGFPPEAVEAYLSARSGRVGSNDQGPAPERTPSKRRRKNGKPDVQLLPVSDRERLG
jgi:hypothetical protein